jgi:hypothetical protein
VVACDQGEVLAPVFKALTKSDKFDPR